MVTDDSSPAETSGGEVITEKSVDGSSPRKKGPGKVPKKIHKAEREKLKRDQLNDLFSELHNMLETDKQNNGKATILGDTTRILRDLLSQVDALRKENAALVKESHYVTQENNELRDEKGVLQSEIIDLQNELRLRSMHHHHMGGYDSHPWCHNPTNISGITAGMSVNAPQPVRPVPVIPLPHQAPAPPAAPSPPRELQLFPGTAARLEREEQASPVPPPPAVPAPVSRPSAMYSGLGGSWTGQLVVGTGRNEREEQYSSGVEDNVDRT